MNKEQNFIDINFEGKTIEKEVSKEVSNQGYSLQEIENLLLNNQVPSGIEVFDDMPPQIAQEPTFSKLEPTQKVNNLFNHIALGESR